jgi:hypothetical protein
MIGHRREDCGTRVRDSCAGASLPTLPLPGCWPRRGAGQRDLLLRPLRAQRRKDGPQRSRVTDARWDRRRFSLSYASIGSKLLSMPGLRHILDSRLAGVANQNEGQSVLVRAAELINAGASARFGGGPRPARFLNCDSVTCDRVGSPDLCLWLRGHDVKCTVSIDRPHSSERVSPRARKRSRAGSRRGCAGGQQGH